MLEGFSFSYHFLPVVSGNLHKRKLRDEALFIRSVKVTILKQPINSPNLRT